MIENLLAAVRVLDLGTGMAPALISRFLGQLGASVTYAPPANAEVLEAKYPAFEAWRDGQNTNRALGASKRDICEELSNIDICIVGGEDHPDIRDRFDIDDIGENGKLIVLVITAYPNFHEQAGKPAVDILLQARTGLAYEHYSNRPIYMGFDPSNYGVALYGLLGLFAALFEREHSGKGQLVQTSYYEGAISWAQLYFSNAEYEDERFTFVIPKDPVPLVLECADGVWIQIVLGTMGSKAKLYRVLSIDDPSIDPNDSGLPNPNATGDKFFGDVARLRPYVKRRQSEELLAAIWAEGMIAERVLPPGGCWEDPQVKHLGLTSETETGVRQVSIPLSMVFSGGRRREATAGLDRPLGGLRVLDFGAFLAGPVSSVVLSDLGADVIKIEPLQGDFNRNVFKSQLSANRGKRSIAVDLKRPEGREIAWKLAASADIVCSNFRPGVAARLGVDGDTLHKSYPELIVLETSGYGSSGPAARRAAFDPVMQALTGHQIRAGGRGNPPVWNRTSMIDYATAVIGAVGVVAALYHSMRVVGGATVETSLLAGGMYLLSEVIQRPSGEFEGGDPINARQAGRSPAESMYEAADGWVAIAVRGKRAEAGLAEVLGLERTLTGSAETWSSPEESEIAKAIRPRRVADLIAAFSEAGVWAEPCLRFEDNKDLRDRRMIAAGSSFSFSHPVYGTVWAPGVAARLSRSICAPTIPPADLGEHTDEILRSLGYEASHIRELRSNGIIA